MTADRRRRCAKRRYRDQIAANLALATITQRDNTTRPKNEARAYYCRPCHSWHLTSQKDHR